MSAATTPIPTPAEIQRKLSSRTAPNRVSSNSGNYFSGVESDTESVLTPEVQPVTPAPPVHAGAMTQPPLSAIAEARTNDGGEESDDEDEDEEEGGWKSAVRHNSVDETVLKSGYLSKKGERRKTWKKRWFVLRPTQLAYYKSNAEYQLLRLLDLSDIHACTTVSLKKHDNTFGLVLPARTFYLQAKTEAEVKGWITAIDEARQLLNPALTSAPSPSNPIPIPSAPQDRNYPPSATPSPPSQHGYAPTSSDSEDHDVAPRRTTSMSSQQRPVLAVSPSKSPGSIPQDPAKTVISGYLMKQSSSKRRGWRKRWFVLTGAKLMYFASHMDAKAHRQFALAEVVDALECDLQSQRNLAHGTSPAIPPAGEVDDPHSRHAFKIVTTKKTMILCAPNEEDEIKWLGAIQALIARRSDPAAPKAQTVASPVSPSSDVSPNNSAFAGSPASTGLKGKVRRSSTSQSTFTGRAIPEEQAER
ncbi:PH domain-like protein [Cylindrobasidium torrendii FP15055 ss-10]|uniref:PH domain-like protein n=1 Tax=Cylindrobasidium torrendii FP15055 ss-10 TaxID=1314674 RepID=A0A0D7BF05_9AGAR|nr:PH domain-like protein [Cylindrobasidium torrendii FP15055 ss-10]